MRSRAFEKLLVSKRVRLHPPTTPANSSSPTKISQGTSCSTIWRRFCTTSRTTSHGRSSGLRARRSSTIYTPLAAGRFYPNQELLPGTWDCRFCGMLPGPFLGDDKGRSLPEQHPHLCEARRLAENARTALYSSRSIAVDPWKMLYGGTARSNCRLSTRLGWARIWKRCMAFDTDQRRLLRAYKRVRIPPKRGKHLKRKPVDIIGETGNKTKTGGRQPLAELSTNQASKQM